MFGFLFCSRFHCGTQQALNRLELYVQYANSYLTQIIEFIFTENWCENWDISTGKYAKNIHFMCSTTVFFSLSLCCSVVIVVEIIPIFHLFIYHLQQKHPTILFALWFDIIFQEVLLWSKDFKAYKKVYRIHTEKNMLYRINIPSKLTFPFSLPVSWRFFFSAIFFFCVVLFAIAILLFCYCWCCRILAFTLENVFMCLCASEWVCDGVWF